MGGVFQHHLSGNAPERVEFEGDGRALAQAAAHHLEHIEIESKTRTPCTTCALQIAVRVRQWGSRQRSKTMPQQRMTMQPSPKQNRSQSTPKNLLHEAVRSHGASGQLQQPLHQPEQPPLLLRRLRGRASAAAGRGAGNPRKQPRQAREQPIEERSELPLLPRPGPAVKSVARTNEAWSDGFVHGRKPGAGAVGSSCAKLGAERPKMWRREPTTMRCPPLQAARRSPPPPPPPPRPAPEPPPTAAPAREAAPRRRRMRCAAGRPRRGARLRAAAAAARATKGATDKTRVNHSK